MGFKRKIDLKGIRKELLTKKSIKNDLIAFVSICIVCIVVVLSGASIFFTYSSTEDSLTKSMKETSKLIERNPLQFLFGTVFGKAHADRIPFLSVFHVEEQR